MLEARESGLGCVEAGGPSSAAYHSLLGIHSFNARNQQSPESVAQTVCLEVCVCPSWDPDSPAQAAAVHS